MSVHSPSNFKFLLHAPLVDQATNTMTWYRNQAHYAVIELPNNAERLAMMVLLELGSNLMISQRGKWTATSENPYLKTFSKKCGGGNPLFS